MVNFFCIALLLFNACLFGECSETDSQEVCANYPQAMCNFYPPTQNNFSPFQSDVYYPQYSCSVPCMISPINCFSNFYVGAEGGWSTGLGKTDRVSGVGEIFVVPGSVNSTRASFGHALGAEIGYRLQRWARVDVSYSFLHARHNFNTHYGPVLRNPSLAFLDSHLVLVNGYFHFLSFFSTNCFLERLNPYVGVGIGVAINRLYDHREFDAGGAYFGDIEAGTHANFGARIGTGLLMPITQCVAFDVAFNANYVGEVRSGDTRRLISSQATLPINTFVFKNNWIASLTLGAKFLF